MDGTLYVPTARIICADMRLALAQLPADSISSLVTDPPYGLSSGDDAKSGFMGQAWDARVPGPEYWREALRVAKPGAYLLAFGGTRTAHRLACAIEDAGWELRDCLSWLYGSGFPKSHDVSKAIDKEAGAERTEVISTGRSGQTRGSMAGAFAGEYDHRAPATPEAERWQGWGTALKPAWEPIYLARKPFDGTVAANVLEHGTGAINVDACRVGDELITAHGGGKNGDRVYGAGAGIPAIERGSNPHVGRWPANLCLDESAAAMLDAQSGTSKSRIGKPRGSAEAGAGWGMTKTGAEYDDQGGPSRFFYVAKASRSEREAGLDGNGARANTHPTVKPVALMRWLVRLITPPGGIVLDPFAGSGSTGVAAVLEGASFIGVELAPAYAEIACARILHCSDDSLF